MSSCLHSAVDKTCLPKKLAALIFIPAVFTIGIVRLGKKLAIVSSSFTSTSSITDDRSKEPCVLWHELVWNFFRATDWTEHTPQSKTKMMLAVIFILKSEGNGTENRFQQLSHHVNSSSCQFAMFENCSVISSPNLEMLLQACNHQPSDTPIPSDHQMMDNRQRKFFYGKCFTVLPHLLLVTF
jgi:hypothetical protein